MSEKVEMAVKRFIATTRELFAREPDPATRWSQMGPAFQQLLADPDFQLTSKEWPLCIPTDRAENLLFYEDPDYGFVINGLVHRPSQKAVIHDHAHIYTLYGVLDGQGETIQRYERLDDGSTPGYAQVRQTDEILARPGDVDLVAPWQIHREINQPARSVAVTVRSERQGEFLQGRYDPVAKKYWQGLGPRYTPYKLF